MVKTCSRCGEEKTQEAFYRHKRMSDGLSSYCKICHNLERRKRRQDNPEQTRTRGRSEQKARRLKNPNSVRAYDRNRYLTNPRRKSQQKERAAKRYQKNAEEIKAALKADRKANPDKYRDYDLRRHYGITLEDKRAMLVAQGGRCANSACRATEPGGKYNEWQVDHDHTTGVVRGLLCSACNLTLGNAKEDGFRLEGLAEYLRRHKT